MRCMRRWAGAVWRRVDACVDRRTLSREALAAALRQLGMVPGATVMVHCSMDEVARRVPGLDAVELARLLQGLLGEQGTLLMPTSPFVGSQEDYAARAPVFDVRRTPSRLGLLSEVFRRLPEVRRSLHPTHSVAASGRLAEELLATHHLGTAFGETSPFYRLRHHGGLVLGLGVGLRRAFTILHVVEELHPATRQRVFAAEPRVLRVVDGPRTLEYACVPLSAGVRRDLAYLERRLRADGVLRYERRGGLLLAAAGAERFIAHGLEAMETGSYIRA
jgi:aminoglycoside 3-N-acetyltransferase